MEAVRDVDSLMMLDLFKTTPFELYQVSVSSRPSTFSALRLPSAPSIRGIVTGFVFTAAS